MMWRTLIRDAVQIVWVFILWLMLFAIPNALLWSGYWCLAAFTAFGGLMLLEYEYHGAVGFATLPGLLAIWLLASSSVVYAGSIALLLAWYGMKGVYIIPSVCVAVLLGGYALIKIDPWLGRLYSHLHNTSDKARRQ